MELFQILGGNPDPYKEVSIIMFIVTISGYVLPYFFTIYASICLLILFLFPLLVIFNIIC